MTDQISKIGFANAQDADTLAQMSRDEIENGLGWRWRTKAILAMIENPEASVLCVRIPSPTQENTIIAGFAIMEFDLESAHLNLLAVDPIFRRRGIAHSLLSWLEKSAKTAGIFEITLEVRTMNTGAQKFYRQLGFSEHQYLRHYYVAPDGTNESAYRMKKRLHEKSFHTFRDITFLPNRD